MKAPWIIVDGYSVAHAWPRLRQLAHGPLARRRELLVQLLGRYADFSGKRVTVVFDAYAVRHQPATAEPPHGVEVVFSRQGKTADDVIERVVALSPGCDHITVVTSDNVERQIVEALGARSLSAELFELEVADQLRELERAVRHHGRAPGWRPVRDAFDG
jgi:predicted RNA-binding protein with PIN domain